MTYMRRKTAGKLHIRRGIAAGLAALMMTASLIVPAVPARAASDTTLTLSTAKTLAVAHSEKIEALELSIESKQAAKTSALKSLDAKQKNMSSFRWSPLLSFKLPTKPNEQEAFEFSYKPVQLQSEIDTLNHKMNDQKLAEYEKVSELFVEICSNQEAMTFYQDRVDAISDGIRRLETGVKLGTATQGDVDRAKAELSTAKTKLSAATTKYENAKKKLSNAIGLDVTSGYTFENPFVSAEMGRDAIPFLEDYAVARDQTLYEAITDENLAMLSLRTNFSLMSNYYGGKINLISGHVNKVISGGDLDKRAFKKDYDNFLQRIDDPWRGKYRIWFVKFPKEWLKGSLDGIRYVEDDPYVLYQNAIDYQSARKEKENTKLDLISTVDDGFENYVATRTAYLTSVDALTKAREDMVKGDVQYVMGQITVDEYKELENSVNSAVTGESEALTEYSKATYELDRTTCGGVTAFFESRSQKMTAESRTAGLGRASTDGSADDMLKTLVPVYEDGITYSLVYLAEQTMFELHVDVPDGFSVDNVNYYELWCDKVRIGGRMPVGSTLRHMSLATGDITTCEIRFYMGPDYGYITSCEFDPTVQHGSLPFIKDYNTFTSEGMIIGEYTVENSSATGTIEINLKLKDHYGATQYAIRKGSVHLKDTTDKKFAKLDTPYKYLDSVSGDLGSLTIDFTDDSGSVLFEANFDTKTQSVVVPMSKLEYINQYQTGD